MSECTHDCSGCSENCSERENPQKERTHELSRIKKVIAVMSGKGGVGKSLVTALLAVQMTRKGKQCAVLDADITGPSIPKMFGVRGGVEGDGTGIYPRETKTGIRIISSNLLLPTETDPVIWRGPVISGMVKQFWTDVIWGEVDYMFIDMPPGTGDVPLTVFQSIKVDGIIVVTSPQELVSMIVAKAVKMANMMKVPLLGVVENMSYVLCPDCGKEIKLFAGKVNEVATDFHLKVLGRIPMDYRLAKACDEGNIEEAQADYLSIALFELEKI
jgi:Mrp family chromosome partitioning ATPase